MTTFSFTTGNPAHLTGGANASMTDIGGSLTDIQTFINGGNIDTGNLATSAKPVTVLGQYRAVAEAMSAFEDSDTSGAKLLAPAGLVSSAVAFGANNFAAVLAFDPADYAVSGLTAKFRVRGSVLTNATASAITFTFGLYPLTCAGGSDLFTPTLGTVTSGSTVAIASPSASTATTSAGSDFTPPSSGVYALGVALSGAPAANSCGWVYARLDVRHV